MSDETLRSKERVAFDLMKEIASTDTKLAAAASDSPKYFFHLYSACRDIVNGGSVEKALEEAKKRG
jgi:hypothetical protein